MVTCLTIEIVGEDKVSYGAKAYESLPRIGECVSLEESGVASIFEVVAVLHCSEYREGVETNGADLYVKRLGSKLGVIFRLIQ